MSGEIIVTARPNLSFGMDISSGNPFPNPGGEGNPANHPAVLAAQANARWLQQLVEKDADIDENEIVVTAKKFRDAAATLTNMSTSVAAASFRLPCFGNQVNIRPTLLSLKFKLTNQGFGPGRAGENHADGSSTTPVVMNVKLFNQYMAWGNTGGGYLLAHETAHTFKAMRDFNKQMFEAWYRRAGNGVNEVDAKAAFSGTPEFIQVEQRANTISREIYKLLSGQDYNPDFEIPHGYAVC